MTDNMKNAIMAINKWFYFAMNYKTILHEWEGASGIRRSEHLPEFLVQAQWTCNLDHMYSKWRTATSSQNPSAYLMNFYAELDNANRIIFIEWLMTNYNDEKKIF